MQNNDSLVKQLARLMVRTAFAHRRIVARNIQAGRQQSHSIIFFNLAPIQASGDSRTVPIAGAVAYAKYSAGVGGGIFRVVASGSILVASGTCSGLGPVKTIGMQRS